MTVVEYRVLIAMLTICLGIGVVVIIYNYYLYKSIFTNNLNIKGILDELNFLDEKVMLLLEMFIPGLKEELEDEREKLREADDENKNIKSQQCEEAQQEIDECRNEYCNKNKK